MIKAIKARTFQKYRTTTFPKTEPELPSRFKGVPVVKTGCCRSGCSACIETCPTGAISISSEGPVIDLGKCIFCGECSKYCEENLITFSSDYKTAVNRREDLFIEGGRELVLAKQLNSEILRLFKRSLKLRQVSAGGCGACEADVNVLGTVGWDLGRFGIKFVASPRHADGLLITGPVTDNMKEAVLKTYEAVPSPKIVIAAGSCAVSGGLFADSTKTGKGADTILPVDLYIPGCPPHPLTILDGLLRLLGRR